jgi:hypothetical protein
MKMKTEIKEIKFQIKGIELLDLNIIYPTPPLHGEVIFKFNINVEIKIINEKNLIMAIVSVDILDNNNSTKYGFIRVNCVFGVEDFVSYLNPKTNIAEFPKQFITTLNSISLSTTRGIMYSSFKGTFLQGATLPIIDPTFLEKNLNKAKQDK